MRCLLPVAVILFFVASVFGQSMKLPAQDVPDKPAAAEHKDPPIRKIFFESQLTGFGGLTEEELAAQLPGFQASLRGEFNGDYDEEALEQDCRKLRSWLLSRGFLKASVRSGTMVAVGNESRAVVQVDVLRRAVVGKFKPLGFNSVSEDEVVKALGSETGRPIVLVEWSRYFEDPDESATTTAEDGEQEEDEAEREEKSRRELLRSDPDAAEFSDEHLSEEVKKIVASAYRKTGQKPPRILTRPVFTGETDSDGREIVDFIVGVEEDGRLSEYTVRTIELSGNDVIRDKQVRRQILVGEGEPFSPILLELSLEKIRQFKHLANVHVSHLDFDEKNKCVDITISMTEIGPDPFSEGWRDARSPESDAEPVENP